MTLPRPRRASFAVLGTALALVPSGTALADPDPTPVNIDSPGTQTSASAPADAPSTRAASGGCWSGTSSYKYSADVLLWTVDVFRHANTTGVCENGAVLTDIYKIRNDCTKYAWGVAYMLKANYSFGPSTHPNTKTAFGTGTCAVKIGGDFHGVGLSYTKQSNTQHSFELKSTGVRYTTTHWTTTP